MSVNGRNFGNFGSLICKQSATDLPYGAFIPRSPTLSLADVRHSDPLDSTLSPKWKFLVRSQKG